jgi:PRTRC genetic system protein B
VNVHLAIGTNHHFVLRNALLIYQSNDAAFVTRHDVKNAKEDQPTLGPAQALTLDFLKTLMEGLGRKADITVLPENVLAHTDEMVAWWTPATHRPMFFEDADRKMAAISARIFPHPPLVLVVNRQSLFVRALAESRRPAADTPVFAAPYWNVYDTGNVCLGSMRTPENADLSSIEAWERGFFESAFTHASGAVRLTTHKKGFEGMWKELVGSIKPFPAQYLVPTKETLQQYLKRISR